MEKPIYVYNSKILRKKTSPIEKISEGTKQIIQDLKDTIKVTNGIGLAAPQIGYSKSIFIINTSNKKSEKYQIIINPKINRFFGKEYSYPEACLSLPGIYGEIYRPNNVELEFYDENFDKNVIEYDGLASRVVQHEYDHLVGKLYIDSLSSIQYMSTFQELINIKNGKFKASYKTINDYEKKEKEEKF